MRLLHNMLQLALPRPLHLSLVLKRKGRAKKLRLPSLSTRYASE
ncbi:hypothetical protein HMPREF3213_03461 [Heyndrickxia coagulans]|uniref:Uncharacterized protein n=1 Tax=Heyndrickxia coagulans TaxID=1398 RepID=A0A133KBZ1_HEYCO|nr:hypothetical protein HMPREF3213_03461 [Heyndrickxia coagulans]